MNRTLTLFFLLFFTLTAFLNNAFADETIKFGAVIAQTGPAAKYGTYARMGMELALSEINNSGGVNGKKVEIIFEDSQSQGNKGLSAFNSLIDNHKVIAVLGDVWGHLTQPIIPVAERRKTVLLSPTVMPHAINTTSPYYFTLGYNINNFDQAYQNYFASNSDITSVALLDWDNDWGTGYATKFKEVINKRKLLIVEELSTHDFNSDLKTETTRLLIKKPDLIFAPYLAERIVRRQMELKHPTKILTTLNVLEPFLDPNFDKRILENIHFTDSQPNEEYLEKFFIKFKEPSQYESQLSYDAVFSLAEAVKINSTDIMSGLKQVKFDGALGEIDFSKANAGNQASAKIFKITGGKVLKMH